MDQSGQECLEGAYAINKKERLLMLKGKNVLLRPITKADIPLFLKWFNNPEVTQYLATYRPMTERGEERFIEELATTRATTDVVLVIEATVEGMVEPIGTCGLHRIDHKNQTADFGIAIGETHLWGKGFGTEAAHRLIQYGFHQLNLHRVSSRVFEFNERSTEMHKSLGFQAEGRLRQAVFKNGRFWDVLVFGLLEGELQEAKDT